jgi:hypothetical protein
MVKGGNGDHWLQLQRIADHRRSFPPPNGSCRRLRYRLSSFVDEKPANRLSAEMGEEPMDGSICAPNRSALQAEWTCRFNAPRVEQRTAKRLTPVAS